MAKRRNNPVTTIVKELTRNILNINWNDHLLTELNKTQAKRYGYDKENNNNIM